MVELAEAKRRQNATTNIHVLYHRYKHNLRDEAPMRDLAHRLRIGFQPVRAFMMPLEKILAYLNDDPREATLTEEDHQLIGNLALPLREAIAASEKHRDAACSLRDAQMTCSCAAAPTTRADSHWANTWTGHSRISSGRSTRTTCVAAACSEASTCTARWSGLRQHRRPDHRSRGRPPHWHECGAKAQATAAWPRVAVSKHGREVSLA
jgi:hypothetical protein